jgi:hypothetical protein
MGKGKATDAIIANTIQSAIRGLVTGGLPGAATNAIQTYALGMFGLQDQINNTPDGDVLGAWGRAQMGYPAPIVNLSTPSTMFSDSNTSTIADGGYQGPTSFDQGTVNGVTVGGPMTGEVDSGPGFESANSDGTSVSDTGTGDNPNAGGYWG